MTDASATPCPMCRYPLHDFDATRRCPECGWGEPTARLLAPTRLIASGYVTEIVLVGMLAVAAVLIGDVDAMIPLLLLGGVLLALIRLGAFVHRLVRRRRDPAIVITDDAVMLVGPGIQKRIPLSQIAHVRAPSGARGPQLDLKPAFRLDAAGHTCDAIRIVGNRDTWPNIQPEIRRLKAERSH